MDPLSPLHTEKMSQWQSSKKHVRRLHSNGVSYDEALKEIRSGGNNRGKFSVYAEERLVESFEEDSQWEIWHLLASEFYVTEYLNSSQLFVMNTSIQRVILGVDLAFILVQLVEQSVRLSSEHVQNRLF